MPDPLNSESTKAYLDMFVNEENPYPTEFYILGNLEDDSFLDEEPIEEDDTVKFDAGRVALIW